ncbi:hypothetical protein GC207_02605 [bacterium]|nr:hypothetical protein [bacterium]
MKRTFGFVLVALAVVAVFGGLVYAVLVAAHASEYAATTVHGPTPRRLWATAAAALGLFSVVIGGLSLRRSVRRIGNGGRKGAVLALVAGLVAAINGALNLAVATGGLGSGNGVAGGAGALVLGLIGMVLGGLTLARSRRSHSTG